ncbi:hypothetical protein ACF1AO_22955 [Streptomyces longwoodensis]|uniref:hypothetical protein n=1 Tax=Streptomyces longwoodensis TaxID=68231 RepID=UPI0036FCEB6D
MPFLRRLLGEPRRLPPTKHGHQPPTGALADGWECDDPNCGDGAYFTAPDASVPRRCETCGSGTFTRPAWPWQHDARRAELDGMLRRAEREGDEHFASLVRCHLMTWTFEDHLMNGFRRDADVALREADTRLRAATREDRHFTEGPYRFTLVQGAIRSGSATLALRIIESWAKTAREEGPGYGTDLASDNASRTNHRCLVEAHLSWLRDERTLDHPRRAAVVGWALETAQAPHVRNWLTADQLTALSTLRRGR